MATKIKERLPVSKHTLALYEGDFAELQRLYPDIGASVVIRRLVHDHLADFENGAPKLQLNEEVNV